jgi:hypothetical protein
MWNEIINDHLWSWDNFLSASSLERTLDAINSSTAVEKDSHETNHYIGVTHYNYNVVKHNFRNDIALISEVYSKLNLLYQPLLDKQVSVESLNGNAFWAKVFNARSNFEMHVETKDIFGEVVFLLYLSDEVDGALILPDEHTARQNYWTNGFQDIYEKYPVAFVGPYKFLPKKNTCLVMRVETAHLVEPCSGLRPTLNGWSFNSGISC